jgi:hypothetical protein
MKETAMGWGAQIGVAGDQMQVMTEVVNNEVSATTKRASWQLNPLQGATSN